jgi:DNA-binding response OmpR family regulator
MDVGVANVVRIGQLRIDGHVLTIPAKQPVSLHSADRYLLEVLMARSGENLRIEQIASCMCRGGHQISLNSVSRRIQQLRGHLAKLNIGHWIVTAEAGLYRWEPEIESRQSQRKKKK